jgi:hypothetical protein
MQKLNGAEINLALRKIRSKYDKLVREYKKSRVLGDAFEDRYLNVLRKKNDVSVFLLAEIEAVEVLLQKEELKSKEVKIEKIEKKEEKESFADKVFEENRKKIIKYPRIELGTDADEEVERLLGAVRLLINDYYPAVNYIYKERRHTFEGENFNQIYHRLVSQYDYKDDAPIARQYFAALTRQPRDFKKMDYEHRFIMQETAFLLNEIFDAIELIVKKNSLPQPDNKISLSKNDRGNIETLFFENFNQLTFNEAILKVQGFINNLLNDFRLKGIKKNYRL